VLSASSGSLSLRDIFNKVKESVPELCDDNIFPCPYCKQKHPKWQHDIQWKLQALKLKNLVERTSRGYWRAKSRAVVQKPEESEVGIAAPRLEEISQHSLHEILKFKIKDIGESFGKIARTEFSEPPYQYDVVWKEFEALPPSHVFEIQAKGNLNGALSKLQHANDMWRSKLFLVVSDERDKAKADMLLRPYWQGTFHRIGRHTMVLTPVIIERIHEVSSSYKEIIKQLVEV
jgi:hypothetical protein